MDLFAALLVTHTFHAEFALDRQRALRMIEERPESAPVVAPRPILARPVERESALGAVAQRLQQVIRGLLHSPATLPRPH